MKWGTGIRGLAALLFALAVFVATPAPAADLRVNVTGLRSDAGHVFVAVFDDPDSFPKKGHFLTRVMLKAQPERVQGIIDDLPPGPYALAVFHDENGNRNFDQGFLGIPLEGYAFSNGASVGLGPPDFSEAVVSVGEDTSEITIKMSY